MAYKRDIWRMGLLGRMAALAVLALALYGALISKAPSASAAATTGAICGTAMPGCAPVYCAPVTPGDLNLPAVAPMGGASVTLSRSAGFDGSAVGISGSNWPAGHAVAVYVAVFDDRGDIAMSMTPVAQGTVEASGDLKIPPFTLAQPGACPPLVAIPASVDVNPEAQAPQYQMLLVAQVTGLARASLAYSMYPSPRIQTASPAQIRAGATITLTGAGWEPGQVITITPAVQPWPSSGSPNEDSSAFTQLTASATTVTASSDGSFTQRFSSPVEPPETLITYIASGVTPLVGAFTIPLASHFAVLPSTTSTLALSTTSGQAGSTVTLTGANWPPNQVIQISDCPKSVLTLCYPGANQTLTETRADSTGRLRVAVTIPAHAPPGSILLQASPAASPLDLTVYGRALPYSVVLPWNQAHPRLALALYASPVALLALIAVLILLASWRTGRRQREKPMEV